MVYAEDMTPLHDTAPAKRGDLVLRHEVRTDETPIGGTTLTDVITLGIATSVDRHGQVKKWASPYTRNGYAPSRELRRGAAEIFIVPQDRIDVEQAMLAYRQRRYASGGEMIQAFSSIEDAQKFLSIHRLADA